MSQLAVRQQPRLDIQEITAIAGHLARSGFFGNDENESKAIAKILAGQELGISPFASMADIHIVQGKPTIGAGLMASKIKQSAKYDYRVIERTREAAEVEFYEKGEPVGRIRYTAEDANADGNTKGAWINHRDNMLFKTCITKGYRTYCPDVFESAVYIHEEMGLVTDGDDNVIDVQATPTQPTRAPQVTQEAQEEDRTGLITAEQSHELASLLKPLQFASKDEARLFMAELTECEPVSMLEMAEECAAMAIHKLSQGDAAEMLQKWRDDRAFEAKEAEQSASAPTISTEEVAKLLVDLTEILPEGSAADFVGEWRAANCAEGVDIYGLSHAQAMSLLQAAREYSALEGAKAA